MAIISSYGALTTVAGATPSLISVQSSGPFYDGYRRTYAQIYKSQPAVRTVVDFFSRNIAQLGLQVFRRVSDTERIRLVDHPVAVCIKRPNPSSSRYRFFESTVQDVGIYANAYWLKIRERQLGLVRLPAAEMSVKGRLMPTAYVWTPDGAPWQTFAPAEIVHFRLYDPTNPTVGFPPLETLRRVLAEEAAAGEYREQFWKNAARTETVITRPATAPTWQPEKRDDFRRQWQEFAGKRAGMTPVLEDGMELHNISQNFKDSEYLGARKLAREEVAAEYHVPPPMVGILDHATFSNIRQQHKQLYQDCLGPWLVMLEEDIELQLLPEFGDVENVYLEFNIAEKLKGSFEEQADSLQRAVGRPYMTANEARARLNLPRHDDPNADKLADVSPGQGQTFDRSGNGRGSSEGESTALRSVLQSHFARQQARVEKQPIEQRASTFDHVRWCNELAADVREGCGSGFTSVWGEDADRIASIVTGETWALLEDGQTPWSPARIESVVSRFTERVHG